MGLFLAGCGRGVQNEAAIRQGVIDYLSAKSGLNVSSMQIDVASVSYRQNEADALISFRPKGGAPGAGMQIRYMLERQGNRWVVKGKGAGAHGQAGAGQMPAGHPQMGGGESQEMQMPPEHPPMGADQGEQPGMNR